MHKKLEAELTSLAHSILQMKNKEDVFALQKKAHEVYEKLSVLAYVEEYINNTPNPEHTKEELIAIVEQVEEKKAEVVEELVESVVEEIPEEVDVVENTIEEVTLEEKETSEEEVIKYDLEESVETEEETIQEEPETVEEIIDELEKPEVVEEAVTEEETLELEKEEAPEEIIAETKEEEEEVVEPNSSETIEDLFEIEEKKAPSLDEELQDTIPVDVVADLFENAPKKSLNDKLQGDIQIGLNDRIAFVKHLFDGSQEDFNRVISQLNTFKTEKEARKFINKMVKPDYNWTEKEEFEDRFMTIVERKFA